MIICVNNFKGIYLEENKKILWDDRYKIGIRSIDNQHKKLFDLVNKLYDLDETKNLKEEMREILYEFNDYIKTHFDDEEIYMRSIGYPLLGEHEKLHADIIDTITKIIQTPATLNIMKSKMRIIAKHALVDHILHEDSKIKIFLVEEGIESIHEIGDNSSS